MSFHDEAGTSSSEGAAFPWILEHLLAYPASYEIPLRTMYTLNSTTQSQPPSPTSSVFPQTPGNALGCPQQPSADEQQNMSTATAAAQLRANLMSHIAQLHSLPSSLPPSFVISFVRRCFPKDLDQVDFPQALSAMDYLKDLEVRRRREVVAALDRLGVERDDIGQKEVLGKKYPGVLRWVLGVEEKERKIEALYSQVYVGLRQWTLINEMSMIPFNKASCLALLNTLYPPTTIPTAQFVQPTAQLTPKILSQQRNGFWRYIGAVEKNGPSILAALMDQHKRPGDATGWTNLHETLDKYLQNASGIIDECYEIGSRDHATATSPTGASFSSADIDIDGSRRKIDSAVSFASTASSSSNRNSTQSHPTRPSTSSSASTHSRMYSKEKPLPELPPPSPVEEAPKRPAGSTLERIAREIKRIRSRADIKDVSKRRPSTATTPSADVEMTDDNQPPLTPSKERNIIPRLGLRRLRSTSALKVRDANLPSSAPVSRDGGNDVGEVPAFDVDEMKRARMIWEAQQKKAKHPMHNNADGAMEISG